VDLSPLVAPLDRFQQRHPSLAIPVAVLRKFGDDGAGNAAALIAYWAFFSLFPLLLIFVTVLGFVLQDDPEAQRRITQSVIAQLPGGLGVDPGSFRGSVTGLIVGGLGTLLAGLGVTQAIQNAFNLVYAVPHRTRPDAFMSRLRGLRVLLLVGVLQVVSSAGNGVVASGLTGRWITIAGLVGSVLLNLVLFTVAFRLLLGRAVPFAELRPGILLATVGWTALQAAGGLYVAHVIANSRATYGTFATVIGLLVWLYLGARIVVYAAEINVVLTRRLWPRSLVGPSLPADRRARAGLAKIEERDDQETVEVIFHPPLERPNSRVAEPDYRVLPHPSSVEPVDRVDPG
jgi:YihY family inner membrane protein